MGKFTNYLFGGPTSPAAGDGRYAAASMVKVSSSDSTNFFDSRSPSVSTSQVHSPASPGCTGIESSRVLQLNQNHSNRRPSHSPNGVRAPRSSMADPDAKLLPATSPRPSMESFRTASEQSLETDGPQNHYEIPWDSYVIPQELGVLRDDVPKEIRDIVQESMDEHQAMWASRLQAHSFSTPASGEGPGSTNAIEQDTIPESSASASARLTPESDYSRSSFYMPAESVTSLESDAGTNDHLRPPKPVELHLTGPSRTRERPGSRLTALEKKFHESKLRTKKSHRLFHFLPGRNTSSPVTPDFLKDEPTISECTSCFDDIPGTKAVGLPCRHKYCLTCFVRLISTSIQHEISYPPKCCLTDVPKKIIRDNLPKTNIAEFEVKSLEYAVPVGDRYYCSSSTCGRWIDTRRAKRSNGSIVCPHCAEKLCMSCRGPEHPGNEDCPQDRGLDRTMEQAERAGWRRCYNCRAMVELNRGCRHITCKCRAEFW